MIVVMIVLFWIWLETPVETFSVLKIYWSPVCWLSCGGGWDLRRFKWSETTSSPRARLLCPENKMNAVWPPVWPQLSSSNSTRNSSNSKELVTFSLLLVTLLGSQCQNSILSSLTWLMWFTMKCQEKFAAGNASAEQRVSARLRPSVTSKCPGDTDIFLKCQPVSTS